MLETNKMWVGKISFQGNVSIKTKKWVSVLIAGFGVALLLQGIFPDEMKSNLERIPGPKHPLEKPIPPVEEPMQ